MKQQELLLSITKICEALTKQSNRKAEETLEFKLSQPKKKTFRLKPPIPVERSWMIGLTSLEILNSIFNKIEEKNKFELHTDNFDEFSFAELKD